MTRAAVDTATMAASEPGVASAEVEAPAAQGAAAPGDAASAQASEGAPKTGNELKNRLWAGAGFLFFALGMVGVALPILPTTPFILVAAFCFAHSSERLNTWFKGTKVYKKVLEGYVTKREMTLKAKLSIIVPVTVLLAFAAFMMRNTTWGLVVLGVVWAGHVIYFGFVVKTAKADPQ